ncbi:hypothetical protein [Noviherbaspirillum saxi]|uniref:Uncharacterized protein n=1 Tax=Noviherbaspirillum saxi TaxID=2320863 RepID=A0A3A3FMR3_9BURK|nr:hypothetical protein [Noviherbaspirillum saxi]RJF97507.1 hypothetical protein D3871_02400 [Noviherbaspirillum saxi]
MTPRAIVAGALLSLAAASALAQQLDARFSCSTTRKDAAETTTYADNGEFRLNGSRIEAFRWESSLFRSTHGFDCSIDESDGLQAEVRDDNTRASWRVALKDAPAARAQRGFDFGRRLNCSIRLERDGDTLSVKPSCPALCGSRENFSELSIHLKTGQCRYEE